MAYKLYILFYNFINCFHNCAMVAGLTLMPQPDLCMYNIIYGLALWSRLKHVDIPSKLIQ